MSSSYENPDRIVSAVPLDDAPQFRRVVGQPDCVARLRSFLELYRNNGNPPEHILILGEDGMGKRTIARAFAEECGVACQEVDASVFQLKGDLSAILTNLRPNQILILNQVAALKRNISELLLQALRANRIEIVIGQGPSARTHVLEIPPFTLICTSARRSDCSPELQNCFALTLTVRPYSSSALREIAGLISAQETVEMTIDAQALVALHSGGRPRQMEAMVKRVARAVGRSPIDEADVRRAFEAFGICVNTLAKTGAFETLDNMSGVEFEQLVTKILVKMDFRAELTKATGDGGIDIVAALDQPIIGGRYLFQCKRYGAGNLVGAATVREFYGAVSAERAVKGILITTSDFTAQAREFAERVGIELINLPALQELFKRYNTEDQDGFRGKGSVAGQTLF